MEEVGWGFTDADKGAMLVAVGMETAGMEGVAEMAGVEDIVKIVGVEEVVEIAGMEEVGETAGIDTGNQLLCVSGNVTEVSGL